MGLPMILRGALALLLAAGLWAETPEQMVHDYALAVCVADGYEAPEVIADASAVASGYLEKGTYPLEAYNDIRELGRKFLQKQYLSIANAKLTLMKCIDFSRSPEVAGVIRKYKKDSTGKRK